MNLDNLTDEEFISHMQVSPMIGRDEPLTQAVTRLERALDRADAAIAESQALTEEVEHGDDT